MVGGGAGSRAPQHGSSGSTCQPLPISQPLLALEQTPWEQRRPHQPPAPAALGSAREVVGTTSPCGGHSCVQKNQE